MPIGEIQGRIMLGVNENYARSQQLTYFVKTQDEILDAASDGDTSSRFKNPTMHNQVLFYLSDKKADHLELYKCDFQADAPSFTCLNFSALGLKNPNILDFLIAPDEAYSALFIQENAAQQWIIFRGCFEFFYQRLSPNIQDLSLLTQKKCIVSYSETFAPPSYYMSDIETLSVSTLRLEKPFLTPKKIFSDDHFYAPHHMQFIPSSDFPLPCHVTLPSQLGLKPRSALVYLPGGPGFSLNFNYHPLIQYFADQGFVFIQAGRRGMEGFGKRIKEALYNSSHPDSFLEDIVHLINSLHASREDLKIDKIFVMGYSFDGSTALSLATAEIYKDLPIDGFVTIGGVFNLGKLYQDTNMNHFFAQFPNPTEHLSPLSHPFLALHGDFDTQAPIEEALDLEEAGKSLNSPFLHVQILKGANHGLDNTMEGLLASTEGVVNFCRTGNYFISEESLRKAERKEKEAS